MKSTNLIGVLCAALLSGCGTGDYQAAVNRRQAGLNQAAPFAGLYSAKEFGKGGLTLQIPQVFKASYEENSVDARNNAPVDRNRLQPPFLDIPGFLLCYESAIQKIQVGALPLPYYCYLGQTKLRAADVAALRKKQQEALTTAAQSDVEWTEVDAPTPESGTIKWQKLHCHGDQRFDMVNGSGTSEQRKFTATFELWLHEANGTQVWIGWRIPDPLNQDVKLVEPPDGSLAIATAGSLKFGQAAPAAPAAAAAPADAPAADAAPAEAPK